MEKGDTKEHPLSPWFLKFSEVEELFKLTAARQKVSAAQLTFSLLPLYKFNWSHIFEKLTIVLTWIS